MSIESTGFALPTIPKRDSIELLQIDKASSTVLAFEKVFVQ